LGRGGGHELRAVFQSAVQVFPGQQVRIAGRTVGSIRSVGLDGGLAVVAMSIDGQDWPLTQGTTAELRYGSAAAYASRFIELHPGPASAAPLPEGGILTLASTTTPVEFDQVFNTFTPAARANLGGTLHHTAQTFAGHAGDLAAAVDAAGGLQSAAGLQHDLGTDRYALGALVDSAARTVHGLRVRDTELQQFVTSAATTFQALAANAGAQQAALDRLPTTLAAGRQTLGRLDTSLVGLSSLVRDLRPGAAGLRQVAPVLERTLATLLRVAPMATSTLQTGTRTVPSLRGFLSTATPFVPRVAKALAGFAPMLACIRPYTPEVAGFASTWTEFTSIFDHLGHYARILVQSSPLAPGTSLDSAQAVKLPTGGLSYAMPRPPGLNVGQPWYQPQCGAGPSALDPNFDPENKR
jgi:phospholipid/cholesterol/gamma-HCH transport system substrate-binding protein